MDLVIRDLIAEIESGDLDRGYVAASMLGDLGVAALDAIPRLLHLLRSEQLATSETACHALFRLHTFSDAVLPGMLQTVNDPQVHVRSNVWWFLAEAFRYEELELDPDTLAILVEDTRHPIAAIREEAAATLLDLLSPPLIPVWLEVISMDEELIRASSIEPENVFRYLGERAIPYLEEAWFKGTTGVRVAITRYAAWTFTPSCINILLQGLQDASEEVRQSAIGLLNWHLSHQEGLIFDTVCQDDHVIRLLIQVAQDVNPLVRTGAIKALGYIKAQESLDVIRRALGDPILKVRSAAIFALGQLKDSSVAQEIAAALDSTDQNLQRSALIALGQIGYRPAIPRIIALLSEGSVLVRQDAARALGSASPTHEVIEALVNALHDPAKGVGCLAAETLGMIGTNEMVIQFCQMLALGDEQAGQDSIVLTLYYLAKNPKVRDIFSRSLEIKELVPMLRKLLVETRYPPASHFSIAEIATELLIAIDSPEATEL